MKLAEALLLRADANRRLEQLKQRLCNNARVQEGDRPTEYPDDLFAETERILEQLTDIVARINKTNSTAMLDGAVTITRALAERDSLKIKWQILKSLLDAAVIRQDRYSKSEVRFITTFDTAALQKKADEVAREYRNLDNRIQQINWIIDLM